MPGAEAVADWLRAQVAGAAQALILEIARNLRRNPNQGGTPVDTGHARRNWLPSIAEPRQDVASDDGTYQQGVTEILRYTLADGALWLANSVTYIRRLNYGHSQQAPAGFIERAIDEAMTTIVARYAGKGVDLSEWQSSFRSSMGGEAAGNIAGAYSPFGDD
jgi:hypothetical protein